MNSRAVSSSMIIVFAFACAGGSDGREPDVGRTGLQLSTGLTQSADVGVRFDVRPVDCASGAALGDPRTLTHELRDEKPPGGVSELEDRPLEADSAHFFADAFVTLAPTPRRERYRTHTQNVRDDADGTHDVRVVALAPSVIRRNA